MPRLSSCELWITVVVASRLLAFAFQSIACREQDAKCRIGLKPAAGVVWAGFPGSQEKMKTGGPGSGPRTQSEDTQRHAVEDHDGWPGLRATSQFSVWLEARFPSPPPDFLCVASDLVRPRTRHALHAKGCTWASLSSGGPLGSIGLSFHK
jgi:hypothetical protein